MSAIAMLAGGLAAGGIGLYLHASRRYDAPTARRLMAATRRRIARRHAVAPDDNGYTLLSPFYEDDADFEGARAAIRALGAVSRVYDGGERFHLFGRRGDERNARLLAQLVDHL